MARPVFKETRNPKLAKRIDRPEKFERRALRKNKALRGVIFA